MTAAHQVERIRLGAGVGRSARWRPVCTCGWLGRIEAVWQTAEAEGTDHLRDVAGHRG